MKMAILNSRNNTMTSSTLLLILVSALVGITNCEQETSRSAKINRSLSKRSHDRDFAPKLTHQPHSVLVQPNKPHTSECPVESQPESEVKWFKDNKLIESEPMHLELTGSELMFFLVNDKDTGDYHCEASNYLGTVTSKQFRLTVQTSVLDENISLDPRVYLAHELQEQPAEFKCTLPTAYLAKTANRRLKSNQLAELVSWRKNGKRLSQVVWLDSSEVVGTHQDERSSSGDEELEEELGAAVQKQHRYSARQGDKQNEFILSIVRLTRARDDNSNFTCLFKLDEALDSSDSDGSLARESPPAVLRVIAPMTQPQQPVKLDIPMGQPIDTMASTNSIGQLENQLAKYHQNNTTLLQQERPASQTKRIKMSLSETLADLYEIAKPSLLIFGSMCLVAVIIMLQLMFIRRTRSQTNRYMKHHHHQYSSGSSSSNNSQNAGIGSATLGNVAGGGDPVLSSLLSRTLSAPSASSLSVNAGKKYKFYRDHMRKVAAAITNDHQLVEGADFIDASAYFNQQQANQQDPMLSSQLFATGSAVPNLYNQSLAAREQARSLLQAQGAGLSGPTDHMRSLGNLATAANQQQQLFNQQHQNMNFTTQKRDASHNLELPMNFAFAGRTSSSSSSSYVGVQNESGPLESGASSLLANSNQMTFQNQFLPGQQFQTTAHARHPNFGPQSDEHYQLVSCSSISPSSTSSVVGGASSNSSSNNNKHCDNPTTATTTNNEMAANKPQVRESISSNHYSTIDTNEEEDRYEELDQQLQRGSHKPFARTSTRSSSCAGKNQQLNQQQQQQFHRNQSTFGMAPTNITSDRNQSVARLRSSLISNESNDSSSGNSRRSTNQRPSATATGNSDQLSPYAVSSICQSQMTQQRDQPPPVTSEAMQALNEQLDIDHLLKFEQQQQQQQQLQQQSHSILEPPRLPFSLPPPPPSSQAIVGSNHQR